MSAWLEYVVLSMPLLKFDVNAVIQTQYMKILLIAHIFRHNTLVSPEVQQAWR